MKYVKFIFDTMHAIDALQTKKKKTISKSIVHAHISTSAGEIAGIASQLNNELTKEGQRTMPFINTVAPLVYTAAPFVDNAAISSYTAYPHVSLAAPNVDAAAPYVAN